MSGFTLGSKEVTSIRNFLGIIGGFKLVFHDTVFLLHDDAGGLSLSCSTVAVSANLRLFASAMETQKRTALRISHLTNAVKDLDTLEISIGGRYVECIGAGGTQKFRILVVEKPDTECDVWDNWSDEERRGSAVDIPQDFLVSSAKAHRGNKSVAIRSSDHGWESVSHTPFLLSYVYRRGAGTVGIQLNLNEQQRSLLTQAKVTAGKLFRDDKDLLIEGGDTLFRLPGVFYPNHEQHRFMDFVRGVDLDNQQAPAVDGNSVVAVINKLILINQKLIESCRLKVDDSGVHCHTYSPVNGESTITIPLKQHHGGEPFEVKVNMQETVGVLRHFMTRQTVKLTYLQDKHLLCVGDRELTFLLSTQN